MNIEFIKKEPNTWRQLIKGANQVFAYSSQSELSFPLPNGVAINHLRKWEQTEVYGKFPNKIDMGDLYTTEYEVTRWNKETRSDETKTVYAVYINMFLTWTRPEGE